MTKRVRDNRMILSHVKGWPPFPVFGAGLGKSVLKVTALAAHPRDLEPDRDPRRKSRTTSGMEGADRGLFVLNRVKG